MQSFFNRQRPCVCALLTRPSIEAFVMESRACEFEGADGIGCDISALPAGERTKECFSRLMASVRLPFMFIDYRNDSVHGADDEARQPDLLLAAEAGAEVIDVMGDLFEPSPFELALGEAAIARQKALIAEIHARGAKVVMSSHMAQPRRAEDVLDHLRRQADRGADLCKIVVGVNSDDEFVEAVRSVLLAHRQLGRPFIFLANGSHSRMIRYLAPKLGSSVSFAVRTYGSGPFAPPSIRSLRTALEEIRWEID